MKGKHQSEEAKAKISEAFKGDKNPNYGKPMPDERKQRLSEWYKKHTVHWYTNGIVSLKAEECPEGFRKGRK